jgi:hypothetical protein
MDTDAVEKLTLTIRLLEDLFDADSHKIALWLTTKNPHLDNLSPILLFQASAGRNVLKFVESALEKNEL